MKKLAIITTHPIQYNAPFFKLLAARRKIQIKVFYTWGEKVLISKFDPGFGKIIEWDLPLLEGYEYQFIENTSKEAGSHHFNGIVNPGLIRAIKNWGADALLIYGWSFKSHLKLMRYFHNKIPVFFRGDSTLLSQQKGIRSFVRRAFLKWVYSYVDKAFYVGTHNKAYFKSAGLEDFQMAFAPHAVDNQWFAERASIMKEEAAALRIKLGIHPGDVLFLYAGKLDGNKNTELLIAAFLKAAAENTHLLIVGNGALEISLKDRFSKEKNVHFLPFQNQQHMPLIYSLCDVFVLPSINETWGLGINEAMACSKMVVASDGCGATIDLICNDLNGYSFSKNNMSELSDTIKKISAQKKNIAAMGVHSKERIINYSYEKFCIELESVMHEKNIK